ncbi:MAG: dTDP-4-dehydrorhamnose reductase [Lachnospiraceae bacterium]|jgi:dTDP-4-dehydrorhamnose reductase|nr:dTDP-4-dehydrorhamnose reductase [Lachnospiraceae bacterium]
MARVLVTGAKGQLGTDLCAQLAGRGIGVIPVDVDEMDITDGGACLQVIGGCKPDAIIHCAAYTAVDAAEDNVDLCRKINAVGTENIVAACKEWDIPLLYLSTDYVFDGQGTRPWEPDDVRNPLNVYGQTKYEGEVAIEGALSKYFIVRISWVFGKNGKNFVDTMIRLGKERGSVSVVDDQIGSPTYTPDLSRLLADMIMTDKYGRYHATNEGLCSWYEFACEIFRLSGMDVAVTPVDSSAFPVKAKRPKNSRMSKEKLDGAGFERLPAWEDALGRYLREKYKVR